MEPIRLTGLSVLIVEDDLLLRRQIAAFMEKQGADVTQVETIQRARAMLSEMTFDSVLLDVNLSDGLGTDLLRDKSIPGTAHAIVMTAQGGVAGAVEAMKLGAVEYLVKPFDLAELPLTISRARRAKQTERIAEHRRGDASRKSFFFGSSLSSLQSQLEKILAADRRLQTRIPPVLIHGETGTGKTTIARWLHNEGPRAELPLVEVNCSALPETLAESELFGHERGAFTDARAGRIGLFEAANGGSLFLDELPSLSQALQSKVLKAIEDNRIRRVGGNKEVAIDARIIAATNRDLKAEVAAGRFREDLYHRLDLFRVAIPPLRERGEDILQMAEIFLDQHCRRHGLERRKLHPDGKRALLAHKWPGNVRELSHELERAIVFEEGEELRFAQLGSSAEIPTNKAAATMPQDEWFNPSFRFPADGFVMEQAISRLIQHALKQTNGNVSAAARLLGVSRDYLRYRLAGGTGEKEPGEGETPVGSQPPKDDGASTPR